MGIKVPQQIVEAGLITPVNSQRTSKAGTWSKTVGTVFFWKLPAPQSKAGHSHSLHILHIVPSPDGCPDSHNRSQNSLRMVLRILKKNTHVKENQGPRDNAGPGHMSSMPPVQIRFQAPHQQVQSRRPPHFWGDSGISRTAGHVPFHLLSIAWEFPTLLTPPKKKEKKWIN